MFPKKIVSLPIPFEFSKFLEELCSAPETGIVRVVTPCFITHTFGPGSPIGPLEPLFTLWSLQQKNANIIRSVPQETSGHNMVWKLFIL